MLGTTGVSWENRVSWNASTHAHPKDRGKEFTASPLYKFLSSWRDPSVWRTYSQRYEDEVPVLKKKFPIRLGNNSLDARNRRSLPEVSQGG